MTIRNYKSHTPKLGKGVYVDEMALIIGQVELADEVSIWPMCVLRGDVNSITVGARSNIQDGTIIHVNHASPDNPNGDPVIIGKDVTVGHQAMIHGCTIGDRVLVGIGAKILDKAIIEPDVIIGAGSLVPPNKRLESGYLYFGSPVKQIRKLTEDEVKGLLYSSAHYVEAKNEHQKLCS